MAKRSFESIQSDPIIGFSTQETTPVIPEQTSTGNEGELENLQPLPINTKTPKGYKIDPRFVELRDQRLQILVPKTLKSELKKRALRDKITVNELVNRVLSNFINEK